MSGAHVWSLTPPCPQEAEKNAKELVAEEERIKKKAEKKKLKKKVGGCVLLQGSHGLPGSRSLPPEPC